MEINNEFQKHLRANGPKNKDKRLKQILFIHKISVDLTINFDLPIKNKWTLFIEILKKCKDSERVYINLDTKKY